MTRRAMVYATLASALALGACGDLIQAVRKSNKPKAETMADVDAAKAKKDYAALEALCMSNNQRTRNEVNNAACIAAADLLAEKGDVAKLKEICSGQSKRSPYYRWRERRHACQAKGRSKAAGGSKALDGASCETITSVWDQHKSVLTSKFSLGKAQVRANFLRVGKKLAECGKWDYLIEKLAHWGSGRKSLGHQLIVTLSKSGTDWEKQFFAYVQRHSGQLFGYKNAKYFLAKYTDFLVDSGKLNCAPYVAIAARTPDRAFGAFNWYFRKANCKKAVKVIAKRLASDRPATRSGACVSLGLLGSKRRHLKKLRLLARTDPYYRAVKKDKNGRFYLVPLKVYDVRRTCAGAANKLALK